MLSEAFKHLRKPIIKGKKINVYRFSDLESENRLRDFAVMESWGWEDVWKDMLEDQTVHRLVKDIKELMYGGWSADMVEDQLEHLTAQASTRLTSEEKTVLLKWLEKNEQRLKGPERGLAAYNRRGVTEVVEPLDSSMDLEDQLAELTKRMDAARRGLGLANKLSGRQQTQHRRQVMINLNKIRRDLFQVVKELEQQIEPTITIKPNTPARSTWLS